MLCWVNMSWMPGVICSAQTPPPVASHIRVCYRCRSSWIQSRTVKVAPVLVSIIIYLSFGQVFMIKITLQSGWNSNVWGLFSSALLIRLTRWWNVIAWKIYFWYTVNHFWNDKKKKKQKGTELFVFSSWLWNWKYTFLEDKEISHYNSPNI